jgi:hypothetical protein
VGLEDREVLPLHPERLQQLAAVEEARVDPQMLGRHPRDPSEPERPVRGPQDRREVAPVFVAGHRLVARRCPVDRVCDPDELPLSHVPLLLGAASLHYPISGTRAGRRIGEENHFDLPRGD